VGAYGGGHLAYDGGYLGKCGAKMSDFTLTKTSLRAFHLLSSFDGNQLVNFLRLCGNLDRWDDPAIRSLRKSFLGRIRGMQP
jgi:hypothetical protein